MPNPKESVARAGDHSDCPSFEAGAVHGKGELVTAYDVCVEVNGHPVMRLGDFSRCGPKSKANKEADDRDVVMEGVRDVTMCGLPIARLDCRMAHGASLLDEGSPDVEVYGELFSLANTYLVGSPDFQSKTICDLYALSEMKSGGEIVSGLQGSKQMIQINEAKKVADRCQPRDANAARNHKPTGSRIDYDPDYHGMAYDSSGALIPNPPLVILAHELVHALSFATGTADLGGMEAIPPGKGIERVEAQAIGIGTHAKDHPTENTVRDELGLERRGNHEGLADKDPNSMVIDDRRLGPCKGCKP